MEWREIIIYIHIYDMHVIKFNHTVSCLKMMMMMMITRERKLIRFMFINRENLEPYIYVVESQRISAIIIIIIYNS